MKTRLLLLTLIFVLTTNILHAQLFVGPHLGFKAYGLKGAMYLSQGGGINPQGNTDAGKTAFNFGLSTGYQIFPDDFAGGWYKLDLSLDVSYSSVPFVETGFNYINGSGSFSTNGYTGGGTSILSFDIMPYNRLTIPKFKLLSPFVGLGMGMNLMSTSDVGNTQQSTGAQTFKGNSEFKVGLLVFYGTLIRASDMIHPYILFKHYVPFGSETQFTNDSQNGSYFIKDVPGYFNLSAGVRFTFDMN
ncbi:MAG: hypothetical protein HYZ34_11940 [Ignavibacteriae bacterium]|nr:hypothetical protein [Ignavibacteriota bacterium]